MSKNKETLDQHLNAIRAGILGSNDGLLTTAGVLFSLGAVTNNKTTIILGGLANLIACGLSMGSGEYNSVSTQVDLEEATRNTRKQEYNEDSAKILNTIKDYYISKGVSTTHADELAAGLSNPLVEYTEIKDNLEDNPPVSPWEALMYSLVFAIMAGGIPLLTLVATPPLFRIPVVLLVSLLVSGVIVSVTNKLNNSPIVKPLVRNLGLTIIALVINYIFGVLV